MSRIARAAAQAALAPLIRGALAEAWDQGFDARAFPAINDQRNPYRPTKVPKRTLQWVTVEARDAQRFTVVNHHGGHGLRCFHAPCDDCRQEEAPEIGTRRSR